MKVQWIVFLSVIAVMASSCFAEPPRAPNIIHIMADDMGWGDLGCYGNSIAKTPNIDRLATEGTLYTQYYANSALCSPSRMSIMTGRFPSEIGQHNVIWPPNHWEMQDNGRWMDPKLPTVTSILNSAGYATAHFGKWHMGGGAKGYEAAPKPADYGIDVSETFISNGPLLDLNKHPEAKGATYGKKLHLATDTVVDYSLDFISEHKDDPFYINIWFMLPHSPLDPPEDEMLVYKDRMPRNVSHNHKGSDAIYYSCITKIDTAVGRIMNALTQFGLTKNTLIVFTSDNGPEDQTIRDVTHSASWRSSGPFRGRKRSLYEGGVRVPFIVRYPDKVHAGKVDDDAVISGADWLPTVANITKTKIPKGIVINGEDMSDVLFGKNRERNKPIFWEWRYEVLGHRLHKSPQLAVRDGKWKFLMNPDGSREELYEVSSNGAELDNRVTENPEVAKRLSTELLNWSKKLPKGRIYPRCGDNSYPWPKEKK